MPLLAKVSPLEMRVNFRAGLLVCAVWLLGGAAANGSRSESALVSREAYLMGTMVRLSAYAPDRPEGLARLERALRALEATEAQLSTWRDDTPLAAVNRNPVGDYIRLERDLCRLFESLHGWVRLTDGAFDPAIGSLVSAWGIRTDGRVPPAQVLERARGRAGWGLLAFSPTACLLERRAEVVVEEGAFGKGEALDRARQVLHGWDSPWVIDLGGQVAVSGVPPGTTGWDVEVADPADRARPRMTLTVTDGSVAVSGGSERDVRVGSTRVSHIIDPRVGRPATFAGSVVVWHAQALSADILSTALFVMGPDDGLRWAEAHGTAVCFLEPDLAGERAPRVRASRAFAGRFPSTGAVPPGAPGSRTPSVARSR